MTETQQPLEETDFETFRHRIICMLRNPNMVYEVPVNRRSSLTLNEDGKPLYPTVLYYHDFHQSRAIMLYSLALMLILRLAASQKIQDPIQTAFAILPASFEPPLPTNPLTLPHPSLSWSEIVDDMCRSIEYHLTGPHSLLGAGLLILPLHYLFDFEKRTVPWVKKIATHIATECGFRAAEIMIEEKFLEPVSRKVSEETI